MVACDPILRFFREMWGFSLKSKPTSLFLGGKMTDHRHFHHELRGRSLHRPNDPGHPDHCTITTLQVVTNTRDGIFFRELCDLSQRRT